MQGRSLERRPLFIVLLPVFFVMHGLEENLFIIPISDAAILLAAYVAVAIIVFVLLRFVYRNIAKAAIVTFITFSFYFFFGAFHDFLERFAPHFFSKYSFLLPFLAFVYLLILYFVKRTVSGKRFFLYLNVLFIILVTIDGVSVLWRMATDKTESFAIAAFRQSNKPDVYLLVLDEYAGDNQLQQTFHFQNSAFFDSLSALGFVVSKQSTSNYKDTPFSMASMLSMSYHEGLKNFIYSDENMNYCYKKIYRSRVVSGFRSLGYRFINNSIFDFEEAHSPVDKTFLKSGLALITAQTLWSRVKRDVYHNFLLEHLQKSSLYRNYMLQDFENNELLYRNTIEQAGVRSSAPKFVYTHLLMPHFPYYFNAKGEWNSLQQINPDNLANKDLYLAYLQYTNGRILQLAQRIVEADKNAIVLLVSDHGFRYTSNDLFFSNLFAVYDRSQLLRFPNRAVSNVNLFRKVFTDLFGAQLPLLPDHHFK